MNHNDGKILSEFPRGLDAAVNAKFGEQTQCSTKFHIVASVTTYAGTPKQKAKIKLFIDGFLAGNDELVARLIAGRGKA